MFEESRFISAPASVQRNRVVPGCDSGGANEIQQLCRCRRSDSTDPAGLGDGCLAYVQVSVGVADHAELNIGQLRKAVTLGRKRVVEDTPPGCQKVSEHVVPQTRVSDSAQPLVQPYAQPFRMLGIGEVRLAANIDSRRFKQDLSRQPPDTPLPEALASGAEPYLIAGAMAGG
jgi:hypothetical protein